MNRRALLCLFLCVFAGGLASASAFHIAEHLAHGDRLGRPRQQVAAFAPLWSEVELTVTTILDRNNFAELGRAWHERLGKYIPNWDI